METFDDITGSISIEIGSMQYLQAQDNGLFIVGPQHSIGMALMQPSFCTILSPLHTDCIYLVVHILEQQHLCCIKNKNLICYFLMFHF